MRRRTGNLVSKLKREEDIGDVKELESFRETSYDKKLSNRIRGGVTCVNTTITSAVQTAGREFNLSDVTEFKPNSNN
jgi:hypothetical protein